MASGVNPFATFWDKLRLTWRSATLSLAGQAPYSALFCFVFSVVFLLHAIRSFGPNLFVMSSDRVGDPTLVRVYSPPVALSIGFLSLLLLGLSGSALWHWYRGTIVGRDSAGDTRRSSTRSTDGSRGYWLYLALLSSFFFVIAFGFYIGATIPGGGRTGPVQDRPLDPAFAIVPFAIGATLIVWCLYKAFQARE